MAHAARHFWLAIAFATASALAQLQQQAAAPAQQWSFPEPLRVCFVSLVEFSVRCNGSPDPALEQPEYPAGIVPRGGWCQGTGEDFCGYDVEVWRCASLVGARTRPSIRPAREQTHTCVRCADPAFATAPSCLLTTLQLCLMCSEPRQSAARAPQSVLL